MMSLPALLGVSVGAGVVAALGKKYKGSGAGKRAGIFVLTAVATFAVLMAINFVVFSMKH